MAIEDRLVICGSLTPEETLKLFLDAVGIQVNLTQNEHGTIIAETPLWIAYADSMPEFSQLDLKETLDITPTVDIFFRLSKPNWMEAQEEILVATLKLIARFPWDIALFHSYSATILVRKESQLALREWL